MQALSSSWPACPKGVCPRSWARQMASTRSSFKPKGRAMERPSCATSRRVASGACGTSHPHGSQTPGFCTPSAEKRWSARCDRDHVGARCAWGQRCPHTCAPVWLAADWPKETDNDATIHPPNFKPNHALTLTGQALAAINYAVWIPTPWAQQVSITCRTRWSGAERMMALPGPSISTKRISPASAFLSTRMCCR